MSPYIRAVVFLSLGLLAVFGWHFSTVFGLFGTAPETQGEFFIRLGIIFTGFLLISSITAAFVARRDESHIVPDEREEKALLRTERAGNTTLYAGLLLVAWLVFTPLTPMQVANAILAVVCVSELVKIVYGLTILNKRI